MGMEIRPTLLAILDLPVSDMTYEDISVALGVAPQTARNYCKELRRAGLLTQYVRPMKWGRDQQLKLARAVRLRAKAEAEARAQAIADYERLNPKTPIPQSVWDVYAKTLSPEEMQTWFRLG